MKNHSFRVDHFAKKAKSQGFLTRAVYKLIEIDKKYKLFQPAHSCLDLGACPGSWMQYAVQRVGPKGLVIGIDLNAINEQFIKDSILAKVRNPDTEDKTATFSNLYCVQNDIYAWDYLAEFSLLKNKNLESSHRRYQHKKQQQHELNDTDKETAGTQNEIAVHNVQCIDNGFHHIISDMAPNISGLRSIDQDNSYELWRKSLELAKEVGRLNSNLIIKGFQSEQMKEFLVEMKSYYKVVKTFKPDASRDTSNEMYIIGRGLKNKKPYYSLQPPSADIQQEEVQQMFNLWEYIKAQQAAQTDSYIKGAITESKAKATPKVNASKSQLLSKLT